MPYFRLETNIPQSQIPADLTLKLAKVASEILDKPMDRIVTAIVGDLNFCWAGTSEPAAQASLLTMEALGMEERKNHSKALFDLVEKELGIPSNRLYMVYNRIP